MWLKEPKTFARGHAGGWVAQGGAWASVAAKSSTLPESQRSHSERKSASHPWEAQSPCGKLAYALGESVSLRASSFFLQLSSRKDSSDSHPSPFSAFIQMLKPISPCSSLLSFSSPGGVPFGAPTRTQHPHLVPVLAFHPLFFRILLSPPCCHRSSAWGSQTHNS